MVFFGGYIHSLRSGQLTRLYLSVCVLSIRSISPTGAGTRHEANAGAIYTVHIPSRREAVLCSVAWHLKGARDDGRWLFVGNNRAWLVLSEVPSGQDCLVWTLGRRGFRR